jgi:hypothetical protein
MQRIELTPEQVIKVCRKSTNSVPPPNTYTTPISAATEANITLSATTPTKTATTVNTATLPEEPAVPEEPEITSAPPPPTFEDVLGPNDDDDYIDEEDFEEGFTNLGGNSHVSNLLKAVIIALLVCLLRNKKVNNLVVNNLHRLLGKRVSQQTIVCVVVGVVAYVVLMLL